MFSIADVFTPGDATILLGGKHIKRTRYGCKLTLACLMNSECKHMTSTAMMGTADLMNQSKFGKTDSSTILPLDYSTRLPDHLLSLCSGSGSG